MQIHEMISMPISSIFQSASTLVVYFLSFSASHKTSIPFIMVRVTVWDLMFLTENFFMRNYK